MYYQPDVSLPFRFKLVRWVLDDVPVEGEAVLKHLQLVENLSFKLVMLQLVITNRSNLTCN